MFHIFFTLQIKICCDILKIFDIFDPGLSQSRGLTLLELCDAQFVQLTTRRNSQVLKQNIIEESRQSVESECVMSEDEQNSNLLFKKWVGELEKNINEAISCLEVELPDSRGGKARARLLEMKNELLKLYK